MARISSTMAGAALTILACPSAAFAGSQLQVSDANYPAAAVHLDFTIIIPEFLALEVGARHESETPSNSAQSLKIPIGAGFLQNSASRVQQGSMIRAVANAGPIALGADTIAATVTSGGTFPDGAADSAAASGTVAPGQAQEAKRTTFTVALP